jgi:hypothetical protein
MITARSEKIQRLRALCQNEVESPLERLKAGERLLLDFGPTEGSVPIIRRVIFAFEMSVDPDVSARAQKLKLKLAKALDLRREAAKVELPLEDHPTVAGTSASEVPRPVTLTFSFLMEVLQAELGDLWRFPDKDFAPETELSFLEAVLDSKPTIGSVQSLLAELRKKDSDGWKLSMSFPLIVGFAENYLRQNGVTQTPEDNTEASKFLADLEVEMSK